MKCRGLPYQDFPTPLGKGLLWANCPSNYLKVEKAPCPKDMLFYSFWPEPTLSQLNWWKRFLLTLGMREKKNKAIQKVNTSMKYSDKTPLDWLLSCCFITVQPQPSLVHWDRPPGQPHQQHVFPHQARAWRSTFVATLLLSPALLLPPAHRELSNVPALQHALPRQDALELTAAGKSPTCQGNSGNSLLWLLAVCAQD